MLLRAHYYTSKIKVHKFKMSFIDMGSKLCIKPNTINSIPSYFFSKNQSYHSFKRLLPVICAKPISKIPPFAPKTNGFASLPVPITTEVDLVKERMKRIQNKLRVVDIKIDGLCPGQHDHLLCPNCNGGDSEEKSLSLFIEPNWSSAKWICFRGKCGWKGNTQPFAGANSSYENSINQSKKPKLIRNITVESVGLEPLCSQILGFFAERSISAETVHRNRVMQKSCGNEIVIAFTYWRDGELVSCKYRDIYKNFRQERDTERIFYGLDDINDEDDIIIVEGEMDKLAMEEAGFRNCVSVPDGAPAKVSEKALPSEDRDTKYQFLWNCKQYFKKDCRIILATDGDPPGQTLAEELARRLGRERCWRIKWPKKNKDTYFKDANEVLMYLGPAALRDVIDNAELYPIRGLFSFSDYFDEINAYYYRTGGLEYGASTGWSSLDDLYRIVPGELTIVTGVPNSGKSEWIDALLCNLNKSEGWKFVLCSMENRVREHARKLLEKHLKKPFFDARYATDASGNFIERMTEEKFEEGKEWLAETFQLIRCEVDKLPSIDWVLKLARAAVLRHGVQGLVIDPYNELDHQRTVNMTETEYVSQMLTMIKRFAQHHSCHVWFVAHPRQLHNWTGGAPNLYDISGSAHFINKCDNGIVVHRNRDPEAGPMDQVQIIVRKVRNKVAGTVGEAFLSYNRVTGEYKDIDVYDKQGKVERLEIEHFGNVQR